MIEVNAPGVIIEQCYIVCTASSTLYYMLYLYSNSSNAVIRNTIFQSTNNSVYGVSGAGAITFTNCVFSLYNLNVYNALITNCILRNGNFIANNNMISYSMCNTVQFPASNNNLQNVNMNTVFQVNNSFDRYFLLAPNSPAIGSGQGGVDMGVFGGPYPYVLSGIPNLPTITYLQAPTSGSTVNGLPITIRVRGRN
ncbi:MAG: hypothetical protein N2450_08160 [bacterium]|nr:hypothetical protein [bacterium]